MPKSVKENFEEKKQYSVRTKVSLASCRIGIFQEAQV
jgi:hypothetical protein